MTASPNDKDGGAIPAFPSSNDVTLPDGSGTNGHFGMSLRDYFAAKALTSMWANHDFLCAAKANAGAEGFDLRMAKNAYAMADAMLSARKNSPPAIP